MADAVGFQGISVHLQATKMDALGFQGISVKLQHTYLDPVGFQGFSINFGYKGSAGKTVKKYKLKA